jgi:hypothetical protein
MSPAGHLKVVDECDYYVLVIGARYGSTDERVRPLAVADGRADLPPSDTRW